MTTHESSDGKTGETAVQTAFKSLDLLIRELHIGDIIALASGRYGIATKILGNTLRMMTVQDGKVQEVDVSKSAMEAKIDNSFDKTSSPYSMERTVQNAESLMGQSYTDSSLSFVRKCRNGI